MSIHKHIAYAALSLALLGCSSASQEELQQWMSEQRTQTHAKVKPISEPKQFKPESYTMMAMVEPFSIQKLTVALKNEKSQTSANAALVAPELARRKEPLEEFPLDTMSLVGSLLRDGKPVGLVKIGPLLYQVRVGEHLGQNFGRVMKIVEKELTLREIVQDAAGEWTERSAFLQVQAMSK
jgi:type IV pilus assembly protein PilP